MLRRSHPIVDLKQSAIQHLSAFEALEEAELLRLERAAAGARHYPARTELTREGGESFPPSLLLKGWLAHQRILPDGRRQIIGFTLPGELFGRSWTCQERALATQVVLNDAIACGAPPAREGSALSRAYQKERVAQRSQLIDNVARLGRMDASERVCDLLL